MTTDLEAQDRSATDQRAEAGVRPGVPIQIRQLSKTYGGFRALDAVDLEVRSGEFLTLLGPSGSGKSTLLMALAGFSRPTSGSIAFDGADITRLPPHKRNIGVVFQNYALFPHMNVGANVGYPLRLRRVGKAETAERVRRALDLVQLGAMAERPIDSLSGGQRQRVALARAIVFEPKILLMDEPLSALDKKLREHMQIEIRHLHGKLGVTTIYVTHDQREALTMSDRIAVIHQGRIAQIDRPRELYEAPASRFVAEFIGEAVLLPVELRDGAAWWAGRKLLGAAIREPGQAQYLVLRPEKLDLVPAGDGGSWNRFPGRVREVVYQGDSVLVSVELEGGTMVNLRKSSDRSSLSQLPAHDDAVTLGIHAEDTLVVPEDRP
ncbi:polyamine-transporting ATPase [Hypericibacter adhaerens]|uniref:Spermidine/putrescine import ATP-binding protein PotA n=2 Tax=Hypericibacter adhaerens TaxID=2602016 RepID=A0A5J6N1Z6_9PROT|nr:polyamine-transporting ATPase [Hypericibacter adhaerens]